MLLLLVLLLLLLLVNDFGAHWSMLLVHACKCAAKWLDLPLVASGWSTRHVYSDAHTPCCCLRETQSAHGHALQGLQGDVSAAVPVKHSHNRASPAARRVRMARAVYRDAHTPRSAACTESALAGSTQGMLSYSPAHPTEIELMCSALSMQKLCPPDLEPPWTRTYYWSGGLCSSSLRTCRAGSIVRACIRRLMLQLWLHGVQAGAPAPDMPAKSSTFADERAMSCPPCGKAWPAAAGAFSQ